MAGEEIAWDAPLLTDVLIEPFDLAGATTPVESIASNLLTTRAGCLKILAFLSGLGKGLAESGFGARVCAGWFSGFCCRAL
jgi:hypothetical protein